MSHREEHDEWLRANHLTKLAFPIVCETESLDGNWMLVDLVQWLGNGKWLAVNEDGDRVVVCSEQLRNPRL